MFACLKGLRILLITLLTVSLAACSQTTGSVNTRGGKTAKYVDTGNGRQGVLVGRVAENKLSRKQRAQLARERQQTDQAIAGLLIGALAIGTVAAVASSNRHSYNRSYYGPRHSYRSGRGHGSRPSRGHGSYGGGGCVTYNTPNPYSGMCN